MNFLGGWFEFILAGSNLISTERKGVEHHRSLSADWVSGSNGTAVEEENTHSRRGGHQSWRGVLGTLRKVEGLKMAAASLHKTYRSDLKRIG